MSLLLLFEILCVHSKLVLTCFANGSSEEFIDQKRYDPHTT